MGREPLTWIALLGLVACGSSSGGASGTSGSGTPAQTNTPGPSYAPGHPCYGKGNCASYLRLPDGGAASIPDGGAGDAGTVAMCGPCNG